MLDDQQMTDPVLFELQELKVRIQCIHDRIKELEKEIQERGQPQ